MFGDGSHDLTVDSADVFSITCHAFCVVEKTDGWYEMAGDNAAIVSTFGSYATLSMSKYSHCLSCGNIWW